MNRALVSIALAVLLATTTRSYASESETFTGKAAASGTHKRPLLLINDVRYELMASAKAEATVVEILTKFSKGDTGTYTMKGTRGTINGKDGILIDSIVPAAANSAPSAASATKPPGYQ